MLLSKIFLSPSLSQAAAWEQGCRGRRGGTRSPRFATNPALQLCAAVVGAENRAKWGYFRDLKGVLCFSPPYMHPLSGAKQMVTCIPQRGGSGLVFCLRCCAAYKTESKA